MKLGPTTKIDKRSKTISKKFDDEVMLANCDVIVNFPIYGQFGAIWKLDSRYTGFNNWHMLHTYIHLLLLVYT